MAKLQFRIKTLMVLTLVMAVWVTLALWMVRRSKTDRERETAVVIAILLPAGIYAQIRMSQWTDRKGWTDPGVITANCPECGERLPIFRRPTSLRQFLWGGWTCPNCGLDCDRHGRKVV